MKRTCGNCRHITAHPISASNGLHGCKWADRICQKVAMCPAICLVGFIGVRKTTIAKACQMWKAKP